MSSFRKIQLTVNAETGMLIDQDSGVNLNYDELPFFRYGEKLILCLSFVDSDLNAYPFNADDSFEFAMDKDFIHQISGVDDPLMAYGDNSSVDISGDWADIERASGKISIRVDCLTTGFQTKIGNSSSIDVYIELKRYLSGSTDSSVIMLGNAKAQNVIKLDEGLPEDASPDYYTGTQVDTLLNAKQEKDTDAVEGNISEFDASGNGVDSGKAFNDSGSSANDIWSADKIGTELDAKADIVSGATSGNLAELDANGNLTDSGLAKSTVASGMKYKGALDASGGTYPGSPTTGDYYVISVAGTISGTEYQVGDWAAYNGSTWDKIDNSETGKVKADSGDSSPGYLSDKVDGSTITVNASDQLEVDWSTIEGKAKMSAGSSSDYLGNLVDGTSIQVNASGLLESTGGGSWDGDIADIDLDGGTDIGADLADEDLLIVDDGAGGTNRKSAISRLWTYILGKITNTGISTAKIDTISEKTNANGVTIEEVLLKDGGLSDVKSFIYATPSGGLFDATISSGALTPSYSFHTIAGEGSTDDDLVTINGWIAGKTLVLYPYSSSYLITVKHNTGNILCPGGQDYILPPNATTLFVADANNKWRVVANTKTGTCRTIFISAGAMIPRTTNGAESGTKEYTSNDVMADYFDFDASTDEAVQFNIMMPDEWDRGTIKIKPVWTSAATAGTGNVVWGMRAVAVSNDDAIDASFGTAQTVTDAFIADSDLHVGAASSTLTVGGTPALGDLTFFEIYRDADNASDTYTQDARLLGVQIQYKESTTEASPW